jgi:hypothetical protein
VERYASQQATRRRLRYTALRLGHVYGAGIARSREIVELASMSTFELPFGGQLASNAIHADNLGAAVVRLLNTGAPAEVYGLCEASSTWRDVFDWHTACLGLSPVPGMSDAESPAREAIAWLRQLPVKSLVRSPATFDLALRMLVKTPSAITQAVSDMNRRSGARGHIVRADAAAGRDVAALYLSDGMPGPFLDIPAPPDDGLGSPMERARELRDWHELWRRPRMRAATQSHVDADSNSATPVTWR